MENPEFLKKKYDLHNAPEVLNAVKRKAEISGEKHATDALVKIQEYLDRLEDLVLDPQKEQQRKVMQSGETRPRALSLLREMVMNTYVRPNKEKLAEGARIVEERAAGEMGIDMQYGEAQMEERGEIAVKDLEGSLDQWISYLSDLNEPYPTWFRYYAFRNILELGEYDKDKKEFTKRTAGTNRLFPDIDRGALARMEDIIECSKDSTKLERFQKAQRETQTPEDEILTQEKAKTFANMSFAKQYAESIDASGEITPEMRAETKGKWVKYGANTDPTALWASLQNKGTAWCTKGYATAETQLKGGDFYVYYTLDKKGEATIPRIAIRMQNGSIIETRGVADTKQNLEGNMVDIAEAKMNELPGKEKYLKASSDMKRMTAIYNKSFQMDKKTGEKTYLNPALSKSELEFLYEMKSKIQGFGYNDDPRIREAITQRDKTEDICTIFDCTRDQIAQNPKEVKENTRILVSDYSKYDNLLIDKFKEFKKDIIYLDNMLKKTLIWQKEKDLDYESLRTEKGNPNSYYLNYENIHSKYENMKPKILFKKEWIGKKRSEVFAEVQKEYGDKYHIPGIEYNQYLYENPEKIPQELKDGNWYYMPRGPVFDGGGGANIACGYWYGSWWYRHRHWLDSDWYDRERILLLEN